MITLVLYIGPHIKKFTNVNHMYIASYDALMSVHMILI